MEFLVQIEITGRLEGDADSQRELRERESQRARELAETGMLVRLWRIPGRWANWGIWNAKSTDELHAALTSLPLFPYATVTVHALASHPSDPAARQTEASVSTGIPGLRGGDHFGVTVPDIEAATEFFRDVIGCTTFYDIGPIRSDTDWMQTHLNVHPRAEVKKLRFLRCGHGLNLELFEYSSPDQNTELPKNSDYGGHHLAIYVDDFDKALRYLKEKSVRILGEPTIRREGPSAGTTWVYFLTPWGMQMELLSFPNGKAYEKNFKARLWHPAFPAR
ncbi:MAG TPA: muconolactone Delta-isomerase family protein [Acidobacteriaceae bacterium]|nr:muconolactone Delta-isomerase family protein [Acidobacteriaceae bacterium]